MGMARFDTSHVSFREFSEFLQSPEGGEKAAGVADGIATAVSKYLAHSNSAECRWELLWEVSQIRRYVQFLEDHGLGIDGRLATLDKLSLGLKYASLELVPDDDFSMAARVDKATKRVQAIKASMRPKKVRKREAQIEALSSTPLSLEEVTAVVECADMWADFDCTVEGVKRGRTPTEKQLRLCSSALLALITFKNWQRAGVAANMTCQEYLAATPVTVAGGRVLTVIKVKEHKTGIRGSAKVTLAPGDARRLRKYYTHIRPLLDRSGSNTKMLLQPRGKSITKVNQMLQLLSKEYGLAVPTPTMVRKIGATVSARSVDSAASLSGIANLMAHTPATSSQFYRANRGPHDAAATFQVLEELRVGGSGGQTAPATPTKGKGKMPRYSENECKGLRDYFRQKIHAGRSASLLECRAFLASPAAAVLEQPRTDKSVQDKLRVLAGLK